MNELDLYRFCEDKEMDWRGEKLIMWLSPYDITDFAKLLGDDYLSEGGMEVHLLMGGTIGLELNDICECFDIEPERIYPKE
ncbi:hypothetical protein [Paenibacillus xylaniclasticus]|uniref:hypothetical protein n=1 Tax=Paenibacillus xylaniclasticus TaxID=588083 RepID=UPI000FDCA80D|nr:MULTISPECIES: hypothetical protein [Paenibacillus]GFN32413.1 hypothetical protein PCURB6_26730 [Paenibacillus curdlanolyticus]